MPHVKPLTRANAPGDVKSIVKAIEDKFGHAFNLFRTIPHQPKVLGGRMQINNGLGVELP